MRRVTNLRLALLLALILPLQAFAALSNCALNGAHGGSESAHWALPAANGGCEHAHPSTTHHDCGTCCHVAAAGNSLENWIAPRFVAPQLALARIKPPPSVAIDRLDRPPRINLT
jgi:hypothetical protein